MLVGLSVGTVVLGDQSVVIGDDTGTGTSYFMGTADPSSTVVLHCTIVGPSSTVAFTGTSGGQGMCCNEGS